MGSEWFAGRLKELREQAGLTQQQLADKAGLSKFGISDLEQGRRIPGWDTVLALASALGVSTDAFAIPPAKPVLPSPRGRPRKAEEMPAAEKPSGKTSKRKKR
jgi:transcriptional regulator with XRE-family HTH domain